LARRLRAEVVDIDNDIAKKRTGSNQEHISH
jgi:hypothetical protein